MVTPLDVSQPRVPSTVYVRAAHPIRLPSSPLHSPKTAKLTPYRMLPRIHFSEQVEV